MTPFQARILRWVGYLFLATGLVSAVGGAVGLGIAIFGPEDQRGNAIGQIALGFGGGFANALIGGGLLLGTQPARR